MKEIIKTIVEPIEHGGIIVLSDLKIVVGVDRFTFYVETMGILKPDKTYRLTTEEF